MPDYQSQIITFIIAFYGIILLFDLAIIVLTVVAYWRIATKAGYHGALSLLMFVPIANIIMFCIFAFSEWPILRELNMLRQQAAMRGPQFPPYPYPYPPQALQYPQQTPYSQGIPYPQQTPYSQGIPYPPPQSGTYPVNTAYPPDGPYPPTPRV